MLVYPQGSDTPLRGDLVLRVILRTDLTPVPATLELEVRKSDETDAALVQGATVRAGPDMTEFLLVKVVANNDTGLLQGSRKFTSIKAIGILAACAPIAQRLQRAVVRELSSLGEIYRACGSQLRIDSDCTIPRFSCFVGMVPSFEVAKVLQEEAAVLAYVGGRVQFRRLDELKQATAQQVLTSDATQLLECDFMERHTVPFAFTTDNTGTLVQGRRESARGVVYRPRGDQRIVNNLSRALIQRRKMRNILTPSLNAGLRVDVDSVPHVAITAAHIYESGSGGETGDQYSQFWLGEVV